MATHDVVLHGATGFVGQLVADYLSRHPERVNSLGRLQAAIWKNPHTSENPLTLEGRNLM